MEELEPIKILWDYMDLKQQPEKSDCIIVLGCSDTSLVDIAVDLTSFLGGENINEFDKRVKEGITEIISKSKELNTITIVTHGGVYRSIYKNILKVDKKLDQMDDLVTTELKYNDGKFEIINKKGILFGETI